VRRKLFNFAAAVSLLLCLGTVGLWYWSSSHRFELIWASSGARLWWLVSESGELSVRTAGDWPTTQQIWFTQMGAGSPAGKRPYIAPDDYDVSRIFGFELARADTWTFLDDERRALWSNERWPTGAFWKVNVTSTIVRIPYWAIAIVFGAFPVWWLLNHAPRVLPCKVRERLNPMVPAWMTVLGASSLLAATVLAWLRLQSNWHPRAYPFILANDHWELAAAKGRFWCHNEPQRDIELEPSRRLTAEAAEWREQARQLNQQNPGLSARQKLQVAQRSAIYAQQALLLQQRARTQSAAVTAYAGRSVRCDVAVLLTALPGLIWLLAVIRVRRRQAMRRRLHRCLSCGYILTGNASGVCPECGTLVPWFHSRPTEYARNPA
jgi:hypothetical protein